jgi:hypothetical protein
MLDKNARHIMQTRICERCGEEQLIANFRGRATFIMPWCKECRALDPVGAKLINDRLRQAQLSEEALKAKNEKRAVRAREIRLEVRAAQEKACTLALEAIGAIDLSTCEAKERRMVERELRRIREIVKAVGR